MSWDGTAWDWIVVYVVPGRVYHAWMRWVYLPVRYHASPWERSSTEDCPMCQEIEREREL